MKKTQRLEIELKNAINTIEKLLSLSNLSSSEIEIYKKELELHKKQLNKN
jgi:ribosomal protein S8